MTCSFSFVKIITSICTDCDYLNNKLYFVVMFFSFQQFKHLSNELELEQFYSSSSSSSKKIFFRVQVRVRQNDRILSSPSSSSSSQPCVQLIHSQQLCRQSNFTFDLANSFVLCCCSCMPFSLSFFFIRFP